LKIDELTAFFFVVDDVNVIAKSLEVDVEIALVFRRLLARTLELYEQQPRLREEEHAVGPRRPATCVELQRLDAVGLERVVNDGLLDVLAFQDSLAFQ
jgi:hypothetical protein